MLERQLLGAEQHGAFDRIVRAKGVGGILNLALAAEAARRKGDSKAT